MRSSLSSTQPEICISYWTIESFLISKIAWLFSSLDIYARVFFLPSSSSCPLIVSSKTERRYGRRRVTERGTETLQVSGWFLIFGNGELVVFLILTNVNMNFYIIHFSFHVPIQSVLYYSNCFMYFIYFMYSILTFNFLILKYSMHMMMLMIWTEEYYCRKLLVQCRNITMVCVRYQPVTSCAHVQAGRLHYISTRVNFILSLFIICKKGKRTNERWHSGTVAGYGEG